MVEAVCKHVGISDAAMHNKLQTSSVRYYMLWCTITPACVFEYIDVLYALYSK